MAVHFRVFSSSPSGVSVLPTPNSGTSTSNATWGKDGYWKWDMWEHAGRTCWVPAGPQIQGGSARLPSPASFQLPSVQTWTYLLTDRKSTRLNSSHVSISY